MNVLLLSPLPPPSGGIARWTERYLAWCKSKHKVIVVNTALQGERAGEAGKKRQLIDEVKRARYVVKETKKGLIKRPSVIHINTSCSKFGILRDWICMRLAYQKKVPVITHCHCNIEDQLGSGKLAVKLFSDMVKKSQKVLVLNSGSKKYVSQIDPFKPELCPNFVLESQIADSHAIKERIEKVIYVGDVRKSKGSDDFYELAKQNPEKQFIVVGSITDEMNQIKKPHNVLTTGRLDTADVEKQLDNADVFLFPSLTEGFSNALLKAMARGLPAIATDVGAASDMIEDYGGVIVSSHDINAMQTALDMMGKPEVRKEMSDWNIKKVRRCYEYNQVLQGLFCIYEGGDR